MSTTRAAKRLTVKRPAFALFEGYAVSSIIASFEMAGLLPALETAGLDEQAITDRDPDAAALLRASLRFLEQRAVVLLDDGVYRLSSYGQEVCRDKGYLVWLVGGYGESLRRVETFLGGGKRYGEEYVRDGKWVAGGAAMLGGKDVVPQAKELLRQIDFDQVVDLGCGNARLLISICQENGARGVGVDISPEACADAKAAVIAAGLTGEVVITEADAGEIKEIDALSSANLVVTFFLLHEILAQGRDVLAGYLTDLANILPRGASLLIAEVEPATGKRDAHEWFTPEFTYVHALMRQILLPAEEWVAVLEQSGFVVRSVQRNDMPGGILLLAQTAP